MNYTEALTFLQSFPDSERMSAQHSQGDRRLKMPVSEIKVFMDKIGNPQKRTKTIHITGSKGKGSTANFITAILQKSGFRTAQFTSPHLHSYTERILFDLQPISEELFAQGIAYLKPVIEEFEKAGNGTFSTFGILTALFFYLVASAEPTIDWQVVEVGLGGTDDLTNIFTSKEAAVFTPISLEHTSILGNTTLSIAQNKAGIITANCLTVCSAQADAAVPKLLLDLSRQKHSTFVSAADRKLPCKLKMHGQHQIENAKTAYALSQKLREKFHTITDASIVAGLSSVSLPGRFEILDNNIVLDAAHNGESARALCSTLNEIYPDKSVIYILGLNEDKNLEDIFAAIKSKAKTIIATRSDNARALEPSEIRRRILACDPSSIVNTQPGINQSLIAVNQMRSAQDIVCIFGSFYLIAEARAALLNPSSAAY